MYSSLFLPLSCSTYTYRGRAVLVSHVAVITPMGQGTAPAQIPPRNVSVFYRNTVYRPSTAALWVIVSVCMRCGQTSMHKKTARPYVWAFYEPPLHYSQASRIKTLFNVSPPESPSHPSTLSLSSPGAIRVSPSPGITGHRVFDPQLLAAPFTCQ